MTINETGTKYSLWPGWRRKTSTFNREQHFSTEVYLAEVFLGLFGVEWACVTVRY